MAARKKATPVARGPTKTATGSRFNFNKSQNDRAYSRMVQLINDYVKVHKFVTAKMLEQFFDDARLDVRHTDQREES